MLKAAVSLALALALVVPVQAARPAQALIVAAGGGSEGEPGDANAWSARLYRNLVTHGDSTGDGRITVAVISASDQTDFIPRYFKWLGADEAYNVKVDSRAAAASPDVVAAVDRADIVFLKGGDQGVYYDAWNDQPLEAALRRLVEDRHGAVAGTSAGAMSLAGVALAGGKSLTSPEVLTDACTPMLDDDDGGSGLHTDFLSFVAGAHIDTHFTERARLGRMLGVMARAATDHQRARTLGIGISERTGLVIEGQRARVIGLQSVWFVDARPDTRVVRQPGRPLAFGPLNAHVLVDGWAFDLASRRPVPPAGAVAVTDTATHTPDSGALKLSGSDLLAEQAFALRLKRGAAFGVLTADAGPLVHDAIGVCDAHAEAARGRLQEGLMRALYDHPGYTGYLLARGTGVSRSSAHPDHLVFGPVDPATPEVAAIVISSQAGGYHGLSPYASTMDSGDDSLHAAALTDLTLQVSSSARPR